ECFAPTGRNRRSRCKVFEPLALKSCTCFAKQAPNPLPRLYFTFIKQTLISPIISELLLVN
ncbi:MAG: hypothetical protein ACKPAE_03970, partial [Microcystis panniformis]